jgi:hypothetical protein
MFAIPDELNSGNMCVVLGAANGSIVENLVLACAERSFNQQ